MEYIVSKTTYTVECAYVKPDGTLARWEYLSQSIDTSLEYAEALLSSEPWPAEGHYEFEIRRLGRPLFSISTANPVWSSVGDDPWENLWTVKAPEPETDQMRRMKEYLKQRALKESEELAWLCLRNLDE